jgi:stage V sporulation protein G
MDITDVRVFPVEEDRLRAYVTIVFDKCFMVSDVKVINGPNGLFISMPSKRRKNGTFRDVAHPLNSETRRMIEEKVLQRYEEVLADGPQPRRRIGTPREAAEVDEPGGEQAARGPIPDQGGAPGSRPGVPGV